MRLTIQRRLAASVLKCSISFLKKSSRFSKSERFFSVRSRSIRAFLAVLYPSVIALNIKNTIIARTIIEILEYTMRRISRFDFFISTIENTLCLVYYTKNASGVISPMRKYVIR